jgi:CheY-like chemotaxis protein
VLILDINMPGEDGISIARRIHAASATPILMLTAADTVVDRVVGLEIGADDYMTKPFDLRELLARSAPSCAAWSVAEQRRRLPHRSADRCCRWVGCASDG